MKEFKGKKSALKHGGGSIMLWRGRLELKENHSAVICPKSIKDKQYVIILTNTLKLLKFILNQFHQLLLQLRATFITKTSKINP